MTPTLGILLAALAQDVPAPPEFREARQLAADGVEKGAAPSCAVAVVRDGRVVWSEGFGWADLEKKTRATADSIYLLASVSKPITATGLMVLKDRGLVDLDAPANRYLGEAKLRSRIGPADEITLRRLANHTSGLATHWNFFYEPLAPPARDESIRRYGFAAWAPGREWIYSNFAYGVLDYVTERVGGVPWRDFMEKEVYDPLGMSRTSDRVRPGREADATAQYDRGTGGRFERVKPYRFDHPGASAIRSSANDLARFMRMHLADGELDGKRVLSAGSAREMRRQTSKRADGGGTGVGWGIDFSSGRTAFTHGGGMPGVTTLVIGYPEDRAATVALANAGGSSLPRQVSQAVASVLLKDPASGKPAPGAAPPARERPAGAWKGKLAHYGGDIDLSLVAGDEVTVALGGRTAKLGKVAFRRGVLTGEMQGAIPTDTGFTGTPTLQFQLYLEGDLLVGVCLAVAPKHFCLPHWVELAPAKE